MTLPERDPATPLTAPVHRATLLFVDDESNVISALRRLFRPHNYELRTASSAGEALAVLEKDPIDLIVSDMRMPHVNGAQLLAEVRHRWPQCVRILLTGHADVDSTIKAINDGQIHRYVAKPWNDNDLLLVVRQGLERKMLEQERLRLESVTRDQNEELRALNTSLDRKVAERTAELESALAAVSDANTRLRSSFVMAVKVFSNLIDLRDRQVAGHCRRVADLARKIAVRMHLGPKVAQDVFVAGMLHDIGKIGLPDTLLSTPAKRMSAPEWKRYREHPVRAERALMALDELHQAARIIRSHQERFDGLGFPDSLAADAIPVGARILALAKDYDDLLGANEQLRPTLESVRGAIAIGRGNRYDPAVVDAFLSLEDEQDVEPRGVEIEVAIPDLRVGMVLARDLVTPDGVLLLSTDHSLDARMIDKILGYASDEGSEMKIYVRSVQVSAA